MADTHTRDFFLVSKRHLQDVSYTCCPCMEQSPQSHSPSPTVVAVGHIKFGLSRVNLSGARKKGRIETNTTRNSTPDSTHPDRSDMNSSMCGSDSRVRCTNEIGALPSSSSLGKECIRASQDRNGWGNMGEAFVLQRTQAGCDDDDGCGGKDDGDDGILNTTAV